MTYSGLGEMSSATHKCSGNNTGWGQRGRWGEIQGSLGPEVTLRSRHSEGQPCSGASGSAGPDPGPHSHSVAIEALQELWVLFHLVTGLPNSQVLPAARRKLWLLSFSSFVPLTLCPQVRLSMPSLPMAPPQGQSWLSFKHRNVTGDKQESEKGCDCSSEPKPDLMVSRVVLGQDIRPCAQTLAAPHLACKLRRACWLAPLLWGGHRTALS